MVRLFGPSSDTSSLTSYHECESSAAKSNNQDREQEAGQQPRDQWGRTDEMTMPHGFAPISSDESFRVSAFIDSVFVT